MTDAEIVESRLGRLPPLRRARLWRLYCEGDRRFLDFWLDGGRALLGAKGTGIGTVAKAALDRGLTRPSPSALQKRLEKLILQTFPGYSAVSFFGNEDRALAAASALGAFSRPRIFGDYLEDGGSAAGAYAVPQLPCPEILAPGLLLFADSREKVKSPGQLVPPLLLACAEKALHELKQFRAVYTEDLWKKSDRRLAPFFQRRGPFLFPRCDEGKYEAFFDAALEAGVLLSPLYARPSILPADFDDGELAKLAKTLAKLPG